MSLPTLRQQRAFFEAFGFLKLPGLLRPDIESIASEFEAVFPQLGIEHDGSKRTMIVPFLDQRPGLCALLDHPGILAAVGNLIGPDFNYMGSDGNYYAGETTWHRDTATPSNSYVKLAVYLDTVTRDTGCLRVIPGSHTDCGLEQWADLVLRDADNVWGLKQRELPAHAIESEPGDVLVFNHRLLHASFGGGKERRMFTMNLGRRARTALEIEDLISYGDTHIYGFGLRTPYGEAMTTTASPKRAMHLAQVQEYWEASVDRNRARTQ